MVACRPVSALAVRRQQPTVLHPAGRSLPERCLGCSRCLTAAVGCGLGGCLGSPSRPGRDLHRPTDPPGDLLQGHQLRRDRGDLGLEAEEGELRPPRPDQACLGPPVAPEETSILSSTFDHPIIAANPRRNPVIDCNTLDFDSDVGLLTRLSELPEHRMARGIRHSTASVIAVAVVAVLSGARSFTAIGEVAGELPQEVLARLGAKFHPIRKRYVAPSEPTIRRHLQAVDADALDRVVGSWLEGEPGHGNKDDRLVGIAVDGKALRGARQDDDKRTFLFAGMLHETGAVIAQTEVDGKTNEIKAMRPLFDRRESLAGTVVTADAMHAQRDHADFIVDERGGDYLLGVKSNQPKLADALDALDALPGGSFSP